MAAQQALPALHHGSLGWAMPVTLGAFFGFMAGFLRREGAPLEWGDVLYGVVAGLVFAAVAFGFGRIQHALTPELHAGAYGALTGIALGFLHSLTGVSVLTAVVTGLVFGGMMVVGSFYIFHNRAD